MWCSDAPGMVFGGVVIPAVSASGCCHSAAASATSLASCVLIASRVELSERSGRFDLFSQDRDVFVVMAEGCKPERQAFDAYFRSFIQASNRSMNFVSSSGSNLHA